MQHTGAEVQPGTTGEDNVLRYSLAVLQVIQSLMVYTMCCAQCARGTNARAAAVRQ